jgi:hypothetical protein
MVAVAQLCFWAVLLLQFAAIWAFEKVLSLFSLFSNTISARLTFFKSPYFGKPFPLAVSGTWQLVQQRIRIPLRSFIFVGSRVARGNSL